MLNFLKINSFAIVDNLEMEFSKGLSVISGETGAGKSIMIDALGLVLGDRAESSLVRHGCKRAEIMASFSLKTNSKARLWLQKQELDSEPDAEPECILRRTINSEGPSRAYINGTPVTVSHLKELGEILINIHSQHEHQALLKLDTHRALLDDYIGIKDKLALLKETWRDWQNAKKRLYTLSQTVTEDCARIELLKYQVDEMERIAPGENELKQLDGEHKRLANAEHLINKTQQAIFQLRDDNENSALNTLQAINTDLQKDAQGNDELSLILDIITTAIIQVEESSAQLTAYRHKLDPDPEKLQETEQRLSQLYELARKHKVSPDSLYSHYLKLSEELKLIENKDEVLEKLEKESALLEQKFLTQAKVISSLRKKAAGKLETKISKEISNLGMQKGKLAINVTQAPTPIEKANEKGIDHVEFTVSLNPGQPFKPLNKVASGGELSRISLAIQVICANSSSTPTLIFDEIDVGVGGATGEIVGKLLRSLGKKAQVISVTHLAQVAAHGNQHFNVSKKSTNKSTSTLVNLLDEKQRITEIARMLGGIDITNNTVAHAQEMLQIA